MNSPENIVRELISEVRAPLTDCMNVLYVDESDLVRLTNELEELENGINIKDN